MSAQISFIANYAPPSIETPSKKVDRIANLMTQVIDLKEDNVKKSLKGRVNVSEAVMIGGDLFNMGYLALQGAQLIKPALAAIPAIGIMTMTCGIIAGAINLGVALICLKESIQASKNGDTMLASRLFLDFLGQLSIGAIMILASLALKISALGAVSTFLAANPWILPVLFFALSIPVIVEIGKRIYHIQTGKNLAAQIDHLNIHGQDSQNPFHLTDLINIESSDKTVFSSLASRMEKLQANMGVEAAIETFKLMRLKLLNEKTEEQLKTVKKKISEWNRAQYVRMFQQILYCASFVISMAALSPKVNIPAVNGTQTFAMSAASGIPLYMDTFWPFKRDVPIVVSSVLDQPNVTKKV